MGGTNLFLYINFINAIPVSLDKADAFDGCGPIRTFFHIILPVVIVFLFLQKYFVQGMINSAVK